MGVVLPDDRFGVGAIVLHEAIERVGHVPVAQVPRFGPAADHRPVVGSGALDGLGVHDRIETRRVPGYVLHRSLAHGPQEIQHLLPAGVWNEEGGAGVFLRVLGVGLEAEEGAVGSRDGVRVMLLEICR